ncbi:MAG: glutaredoxin-like protein NrdH [Promicromonosporaceae bacterium]|nr:glutaredoxin-like protein NrdH [Promicromonosporaceae bacterium]
MSITVYSKPSCVQCTATYRALDKQGLAYQVIDLTQEPSALDMVRGLGYLQAPVVVTEDSHWSGFRPDRINELAAASARALSATSLAAAA